MVIMVLFIVVMAIWFLSNMPIPQAAPYREMASGWLAFFAVLLLGVFIFMPGLR